MKNGKELEKLKAALSEYVKSMNQLRTEYRKEAEAIFEDARKRKIEELRKKIKSHG